MRNLLGFVEQRKKMEENTHSSISNNSKIHVPSSTVIYTYG